MRPRRKRPIVPRSQPAARVSEVNSRFSDNKGTFRTEFWLTFELTRDRLTKMKTDYSLLEAALIGYQHQRELLEVKIADIQRQLGNAPATVSDEKPKKRVMNAAARKRIALAQRKRWAEFHKTKGTPAKKRMMSAEGRERIAEATRKRWAEFRAAKAASAGKTAKKAGKRATRTAGAGGAEVQQTATS
jgi:hypothetical protein